MEKKYIVYQITNKLTNMIYIGVHVTTNINDSYMGSGTKIRKAIKEYGLENFEKIILYQFDNKQEMLAKEKELVDRNFISREDTYNIMLGGGQFLSIDLVTVKDKDGNTFCVNKFDPRYLSGEWLHITKDTLTVRDKYDNNFKIQINDPRYLSGEFIPYNKGLILVKNIENKFMIVSPDDPRYLSGELTLFWIGRKHKFETKKIIGEKNSIHQKGEGNSQFGTCWVMTESESKRIKKDELDEYLLKGWIKGRKMVYN